MRFISIFFTLVDGNLSHWKMLDIFSERFQCKGLMLVKCSLLKHNYFENGKNELYFSSQLVFDFYLLISYLIMQNNLKEVIRYIKKTICIQLL